MSEWISVEDRLPSVERDDLKDSVDDVLIVFKVICEHCGLSDNSNHYGIGYLYGKTWNLTPMIEEYAEGYMSQIEVTHWMTLPEPPK